MSRRLHPLGRRPARGGFTLIELLVALAVLGIFGAALAGVLRNAADSVSQADAAINHMERLRSLDLLLCGALRDAVTLTLSAREVQALKETDAGDDEGSMRFRGEPHALGFCLRRPFLSPDRDGYMHWVLLEVRSDEETERQSLWLRDVSFVPGVDNPIGADWGGLAGEVEDRLPVLETCLIRDADEVTLRYWLVPEDETEEPEEMEPEPTAGNYASALPDRIELDIKMPMKATDVLTFDYRPGRGWL